MSDVVLYDFSGGGGLCGGVAYERAGVFCETGQGWESTSAGGGGHGGSAIMHEDVFGIWGADGGEFDRVETRWNAELGNFLMRLGVQQVWGIDEGAGKWAAGVVRADGHFVLFQ